MVSFILSDCIGLEHFVGHGVIHFFDSDLFNFLFSQGVHFRELQEACIDLDIEPLSHRQVVDVVLWVVHDTEK